MRRLRKVFRCAFPVRRLDREARCGRAVAAWGTGSIRTSDPVTAHGYVGDRRGAVRGTKALRAAGTASPTRCPRRPPESAPNDHSHQGIRRSARCGPTPRQVGRDRLLRGRSRWNGSCLLRRASSAYGWLFPAALGQALAMADSLFRKGSWQTRLNAPREPSVPTAIQAPQSVAENDRRLRPRPAGGQEVESQASSEA